MNIAKIIIVTANIPILICCLFAIKSYKYLPKELQVFSWFIFVSTVIQLSSLSLWAFSINNMFMLHLYVNTGFGFLVWFYVRVLDGFIISRVMWIGTALFWVFNIVHLVLNNTLFVFNSISLTIESILVIIMALSTYVLLLNPKVREMKQDMIVSLNWINSGLFIYFVSNILLFYFGELIMETFSKELSRYLWILHSLFSDIMYACFFIGLWKRSKPLN